MALEGNYTFAGIGAAEAKDRISEHRTGVPALGDRQALLSAPIRFTTGVKIMNQGENAADVRLAHGQSEKAVTAELLAALSGDLTTYRGKLQFANVKPGSVTIVNGGAPDTLIDDGAGLLVEQASPATQRGTINYTTGTVDWTYGAAATEPVSIAYTHTDFVEFAFAQTETPTVATSYPENISTVFGRVVPGSVTVTDGVETFVDDGKGNMLETTAGIAVVRGSINYGTGAITLTGGTGTLANPTTLTYNFNPFGAVVQGGGGSADMTLLTPDIPEIGSESFADGIKGESRLGLIGETTVAAKATDLLTQWSHHVEEPYRVKEEFTAFPPGGASNDPRIDQGF